MAGRIIQERRRAFGLPQFAEMFSVSRDTAKRLAKSGDLRTFMVGGRRLVPASEVERIERDGLAPKPRLRKKHAEAIPSA